MIATTLQAMQRLGRRDALTAADMPNIMRVLLIQVGEGMRIREGMRVSVKGCACV
jgi:hypothetical protein